MIDLVERLRAACPSARDYTEETHNKLLLCEAADEIERLRAQGDVLFASIKSNADEIERLTAELNKYELAALQARTAQRKRDD